MSERKAAPAGADRLDTLIQRAIVALEREPRGDLARGLREVVWQALGRFDRLGRERRARLAIAAARQAIPVWEQTWPGDRRPHELLGLAEGVLGGSAPIQAARSRYDEAIVEMDDAANAAENQIPVSAGYAAARALMASIEDEAFNPSAIDYHRTDDETDPDDRDAGYFAAVAVAGGPPWDASSDPEARRSFWRRWLAEALRVSQRDSS